MRNRSSTRCQLFDAVERTDPRPSGHAETSFSFLNRVQSAPFEQVRWTLEQWFAEWPADGRADVRSRFRSSDNRNFLGAFWEIYLREVFRKQGFDISAHPAVPGSPYHPDFLLSRGDESFYIEATVVHPSLAEEAAQKLESAIYDTLDQLDSPNFFLEIEICTRGTGAPPVTRHRKRIEQWLAGLSPSAVQNALDQSNMMNSGDDGLAVYDIDEAGWSIQLRPLPKSPESRGMPGIRPLGVFLPFDDDSPIDDVAPLRRALKRKTKYGRLDKPLVLAILVDLPFIGTQDVESALFGSMAIRYTQRLKPSDVVISPYWVRQSDGFYRDRKGPANRDVSAVLVATNLRPWTIASEQFGGLGLWPHPWAHEPFASEVPFAQAVFVSEPPTHEIRHTKAPTTPRQLVGLPERWPGFEN